MTTGTVRKIVHIDEELCNGCGVCIPSCAEGALQIIDGRARLISEKFCDGLGACLGECPQDAITVEERYAEEFDEALVEEHLAAQEAVADELPCGCPSSTVTQFDEPGAQAGGCPSARVTNLAAPAVTEAAPAVGPGVHQPSTLRHWPVQLTLVPPSAPFLQDTDLVLAADCVPFAYAGFHQDFLKDHSLLIACPKLDDFQAHLQKLTEVLRQSSIRSLTVVHMEVPCCFGIVQMARQAIQASGKDIPLEEVTIGVRGEVVA
jgi:ferredoxin